MPPRSEDRFPRAILHVDMDAFYASVEVLDDPSLFGRPVIVGGTPEGRGVVAAASYEARAFGVGSAMSAARARRLCPDGVFLPSRMARYVEVSRQVFAVFRDYTPLVEPVSIDEAFLDVSGCLRLFGPPVDVGRLIKDRIRRDVGLTASVGLAANKFLAKLASDLEKPDGFVVVRPGRECDLLAGLPVGRLWGVGKVTGEQFRRHGIVTIADLLAAPEADLVRRFGDHVRHLRELAQGHDERPVVPSHRAKSIGNEVTFAEDIADADHLGEICDHLADKVARRLRTQGFLARTVVLKARYPDFETPMRSLTLDGPTASGVVIRDAVRELLGRRLGRSGRPLRLVGVTATNLVRAVVEQASLFPDQRKARDSQLDQVLDDVHDRFGPLLRRGCDRFDPRPRRDPDRDPAFGKDHPDVAED